MQIILTYQVTDMSTYLAIKDVLGQRMSSCCLFAISHTTPLYSKSLDGSDCFAGTNSVKY